ncbi:DUF4870 domain-containing protein [Chitinophaga sp. Mgbs1]|uniref:DUF4870 domain-containing protein n=1 Tax=Chitinophaga solisilvae TaxID=1233460 RepID=A0A9Q5GKX0_9BACT|nr:DUF4870 domain-containing protein [Chitinophaga solisilvae]
MDQKEERNWGTYVHLGGILGTIIIPTVGNIVLVLVLWLIKRNESKFVDEQGKEAINFQITISLVGAALSIIGNITSGLWSLSHIFWHSRGDYFDFSWGWHSLHPILWVINIIFSIIAAVKANEGISYKNTL